MNILLSNDDGIHAAGLHAMYRALIAAGHSVQVFAPLEEKSGVSNALTVFSPLRARTVHQADFTGTGISGTPTDCVKFGLCQCKNIDLVISGMNRGANIGVDIVYSGTLGAAIEAALNGVPAIAVSYRNYVSPDFSSQATHAAALVDKIKWQEFAPQTLININYPACIFAESKGVRVCRHSTRMWPCAYEERKDPMGVPYWWLTGIMHPDITEPDSDCVLLDQGYITVTPIHVDYNAAGLVHALKRQLADS